MKISTENKTSMKMISEFLLAKFNAFAKSISFQRGNVNIVKSLNT